MMIRKLQELQITEEHQHKKSESKISVKEAKQDAKEESNFGVLPNDVLYEILSNLDIFEILQKVAFINKRLAWVVRCDPSFWRTVASKKSKELELPDQVFSSRSFFRRNQCTSELLAYWKSLSLYAHHKIMNDAISRFDGEEQKRKVVCVVRLKAEPSLGPQAAYRIKDNSSLNLWHSEFKDGQPQTIDLPRIYGPKATQEMVYRENVAFPILNAVMAILEPTLHIPRQTKGGSPPSREQHKPTPRMLTFIAYGSTGSGKSHTLFGESKDGKLCLNPGASGEHNKGIVPRACHDLFDFLRKYKKGSSSCSCSPSGATSAPPTVIIRLSMFEIIEEQIFDLLEESNRDPLQLSEDILEKRISIEGLSEHYISNEVQMLEEIQAGLNHRKTASQNFSCIYTQIKVNIGGEDTSRQANFLFVEWKGNERDVRHKAIEGSSSPVGFPYRRPSSKLSSFVFGTVINALYKNRKSKQYIPYRASKTTRILQDSFGGSAKTTFFFTCSLSMEHLEETVTTLKAAKRSYELRNTAAMSLCKFY